jgi:sporulation integral membrane protein YtvI
LVVGAVAALMISQVTLELWRLASELPRYGATLKEGLQQLDTLYRSWQLPPQVLEATEASIEAITKHLQQLLTRLIQDMVGVAAGIPRFFIALIIVLVSSFFFSRDKVLIRKACLSAFPWLAQPQVAGILQEMGQGILGYFKAQTLLVSFTALQVLTGLHLLGIKYAVSLSLFIALLDILPVVGPGTVFLPWAGWELINRRFTLGLALIVLYATITVVRVILEPKVVGRNLGLHPLAALASIYIGLQALGLTGAVLGPLLLVFLKAAYHAGIWGRRPS